MKSRTKSHLSEEQIKELVKVNFGDTFQVGKIKELKGGMFNSAFLIENQNNSEKMVLKVSVDEKTPILSYEKATMETEVEVYKLISSQTNIPAPKVLGWDFSKQYITCNYFFMTALDGEIMTKVRLSKDNRNEIMEELANCFASLHKIKEQYYGYFREDKELQFKTWKDGFCQMLEMILSDGRKHGIKLPYDRYEKQWKDKSKYFEDIKEPVLVNYDLHPGNIFLKKQGEKYVIEGIVDFERAFWGDAYADFPAAFLFTKDISKEVVFWTAYKKAAGIDHDLTKEEKIRLLFYRLYIFTIMQVEVYRYGFLYSRLQGSLCRLASNKCLKELEQL